MNRDELAEKCVEELRGDGVEVNVEHLSEGDVLTSGRRIRAATVAWPESGLCEMLVAGDRHAYGAAAANVPMRLGEKVRVARFGRELDAAKFRVEVSDPTAAYGERDEIHRDLSIADAACQVEDLTGIPTRVVFLDLATEDRFQWKCPESAVTVTAERVAERGMYDQEFHRHEIREEAPTLGELVGGDEAEEAGDMLTADGLGAEPAAAGAPAGAESRDLSPLQREAEAFYGEPLYGGRS